MVFHRTGPGKVHSYSVGPGTLYALLYNFDFDDMDVIKHNELKIEHQRFLKESVVPLINKRKGHIWMQGSASRIGESPYNQSLSENRVARVFNLLMSNGIDDAQMQTRAIGEDMAVLSPLDYDRDRSVALWVRPVIDNSPPPEPKVPKPLITRKFRISVVTALSASQAMNMGKILRMKIGGGIGIDVLVILIWDTENNIACMYVYVGVGLVAGFAGLPSASVTTHGPWTEFTTEKPMPCWRFGRWARFTSIGVGARSKNYITMETPPGINNVDSLSIGTGTTYGAGASTSVGDVFVVDKPYRFSGP